MGYQQIGCFPSCTALAGDGGFVMGAALWFELCHPTDTCEDSTATCLTSQYLPGSLSRCLPASLAGMAMGNPPDATLKDDKNAVNCGSTVCGADEQCCIRQPLAPYCAPKSATCACTAPEGGTPGAGGHGPDGGHGRPDSSVPPDSGSGHDASDGATTD
jgi:hypothetical protein